MKDMKKNIRYFALAIIAAAGISCSRDVIIPEPVMGDGAIMLDVSSMPHTKAFSDVDLQSVGPEAYVNHIDLFVFGQQQDGITDVHYERISYSNPASPETRQLGKAKNQFVTDQTYEVYVIANSTAAETDMAAITAADDLEDLMQTDEFIHFTGLDVENVPEAFLMDYHASVVLNPENKEAEDTEIKVQLTRAAAKIVVQLTQGNDVAFSAPDNEHVYHFRNLPYSTKVLGGDASYVPSVRSTLPHQVNGYVSWNPESNGTITFTGYVYEYDFAGKDLDMHTNLVVNIPLTIGSNEYPVNYYKIPLSNTLKFERNHIYRIKAEVKAPGAQTSYDPIEIEDITYNVTEWTSYDPIKVGGDVNKPKYLQLNTNHVDMYNKNEDNTSLTFASSSKITNISLVAAYYFNKHGVRTEVGNDIRAGIAAQAEKDVLNGGISILSPIVETTEEERDEMEKDLLDRLGLTSAPSYPGSAPQNPVLPEVTEPDPAGYLPDNTFRYTYSYEGTGKNVKFYRSSYGGSKTPYATVQDRYDRDYAAYENYITNWGGLSDAEKQKKIEEYKESLLEYEAENAVYSQWKAAYDMIQATIEPTHYNTIRYLEFEVTNEQGLTVRFTVDQYPVIYITNSLGWYSYRKDFKTSSASPTSYVNKGDRIVSVSLNINGNGEYDWKNVYSTSGGSGYWYSKVRTGTNTTGTTRYSSYSWGTNSNSPSATGNSSTNLRMYHVHVTTTSPDYVLARPQMVTNTQLGVEVTDPSAENQRLVSPSFMIASRLGFFTTDGGNLDDANDAQRLNVFRVHCANYVEVHGDASNPIVYDNWRLPTEAELKIIMDTQGKSGENAAAVDYLLNAEYYFGAAGPVWNSKNDDGYTYPHNSDSKSVRCVRDSF